MWAEPNGFADRRRAIGFLSYGRGVVLDEKGSGVNLTVKSPSPLLRIHPATNKDAFPASQHAAASHFFSHQPTTARKGGKRTETLLTRSLPETSVPLPLINDDEEAARTPQYSFSVHAL